MNSLSTIPSANPSATELPANRLADEISVRAVEIQSKSDRLKVQAWWATGLWLLFVAVFAAVSLATAPSLVFLDLNEFGDFFAGVSAPLAFLWLVVGFYQQGYELRLNTLALNGQLEELRESVRQQKLAVDSHRQMSDVAKNSHEFEVKRYMEQVNAEIEAAQPIYEIQKNGYIQARGANERVQAFTLLNAGSTASLAQFVLRERGFLTQWSPPQNNETRRGGSFDLSIVFDQMDFSEQPAIIRCNYRDARGGQRWQDFMVTIDRSARMIAMALVNCSWSPANTVPKT